MTVNNLYVTYDDGGQPHFHINDEEVTEQEWKLRHPMMKEGNANGGNSNGGQLGRSNSDLASDESDPKERQRQGLRDHRAKLREAQAKQDHDEGTSG